MVSTGEFCVDLSREMIREYPKLMRLHSGGTRGYGLTAKRLPPFPENQEDLAIVRRYVRSRYMTTDSWEKYENFKKEIDAGEPARKVVFDLMKEQQQVLERQNRVYRRDDNVDKGDGWMSKAMTYVKEFSFQVIKLVFQLDKSVVYQIAPTPQEPVLPPAAIAQQLQD